MTVWGVGDVVIIYLGALQGVSRELYEAAEVDGAGPLGEAPPRHDPDDQPGDPVQPDHRGDRRPSSTSPRRTSSARGRSGEGSGAIGGIQNSLLFYGLNLYNNAFRYFRIGYASALAWILLADHPGHHDPAAARAPAAGSTTRAGDERDRRSPRSVGSGAGTGAGRLTLPGSSAYVVLIGLAPLYLAPFLWMVATSLKTGPTRRSPSRRCWIPDPIVW